MMFYRGKVVLHEEAVEHGTGWGEAGRGEGTGIRHLNDMRRMKQESCRVDFVAHI